MKTEIQLHQETLVRLKRYHCKTRMTMFLNPCKMFWIKKQHDELERRISKKIIEMQKQERYTTVK